MSRIDYTPREEAAWKYPWAKMLEVGDYFDIPPGNPRQAKGIRNCAYMQGQLRGATFITKTLRDGTIRCMLVALDTES